MLLYTFNLTVATTTKNIPSQKNKKIVCSQNVRALDRKQNELNGTWNELVCEMRWKVFSDSQLVRNQSFEKDFWQFISTINQVSSVIPLFIELIIQAYWAPNFFCLCDFNYLEHWKQKIVCMQNCMNFMATTEGPNEDLKTDLSNSISVFLFRYSRDKPNTVKCVRREAKKKRKKNGNSHRIKKKKKKKKWKTRARLHKCYASHRISKSFTYNGWLIWRWHSEIGG